MELQSSYHTLTIRHDVCVGCSHCIKVCPTEALRVKEGKALLYPDRCVSCGECYRVCPSCAIDVEDDDFKRVHDFKYRIVLIPSVFFGQFNEQVSQDEINRILLDLGFTDVCRVEHTVNVLAEEIRRYIPKHELPVISSFCPAVVRLIQVNFPALVGNIMQLKQPLEITTLYLQQLYINEKNAKPEDIGIFYITPCAAKIASVKAPVGESYSPVTGVINMKNLYNRVYQAYKQKKIQSAAPDTPQISAQEVKWTLTGGEAESLTGFRCLAVDGVNNVMDILERLENGEITGIDYLELRMCDESCPGGILTQGSRFLTALRLRDLAEKAPKENSTTDRYHQYLVNNMPVGEVKPLAMIRYDRDVATALKKMEQARRLKKQLPGIDCGACGAPSCEALAEDVVCGLALPDSCIFMQTQHQKDGTLSMESGINIRERIWGKDRFKNNHPESI